jgi:hypothetical protein
MSRAVLFVSLLAACAGRAKPPEVEAPPAGEGMDLAGLGRALAKIDPAVSGPEGAWQLEYQGVKLMCLAQENVDRMRIFVPIATLADVSDPQLAKAMEANFQGALDARYATSRGVLFSVYVHPLSTLDERTLVAAIHQVASLATTFGTSYTSGATAF